jgi:SRSO17 transposase
VLIVDETADEKSSGNAAGAARQYSGTAGGIALCQVGGHLDLCHRLRARADRPGLYPPVACAADEEHRELAGIPEQVMFASKPQLAGSLIERAHRLGIRAAFVAGRSLVSHRQPTPTTNSRRHQE